MADILHRVGIASSTEAVYKALATIDGLSHWWTGETRGDTSVGGLVHFQFGDRGFFQMKVLDSAPHEHVRWEVVDGPAEWIGTTIDFSLRQEGDYVIVLFRHLGWRDPVEFFHHCSTKWAVFLLSLKALVETGRGAAYPNDQKIDDWN